MGGADLTQAAITAVFVFLGQAGTSVRGAYDALVAMTIIWYFIPFLLLFAAAIKLRGEAKPHRGFASRAASAPSRLSAWSAC